MLEANEELKEVEVKFNKAITGKEKIAILQTSVKLLRANNETMYRLMAAALARASYLEKLTDAQDNQIAQAREYFDEMATDLEDMLPGWGKEVQEVIEGQDKYIADAMTTAYRLGCETDHFSWMLCIPNEELERTLSISGWLPKESADALAEELELTKKKLARANERIAAVEQFSSNLPYSIEEFAPEFRPKVFYCEDCEAEFDSRDYYGDEDKAEAAYNEHRKPLDAKPCHEVEYYVDNS